MAAQVWRVAMQQDEGSDLIRVQRRHVARMPVPPFPRGDFYALLQLAWAEGVRTSGRLDESGSGVGFGPRIPWAALERTPYAQVWQAVQWAFFTYRKQHGIRPGHMLCWLACEYGLYRTYDRKGMPMYVWHRPDVNGAVMTREECAKHYHYTVATVAEYVRKAQEVVEHEWSDVWLIGHRG